MPTAARACWRAAARRLLARRAGAGRRAAARRRERPRLERPARAAAGSARLLRRDGARRSRSPARVECPAPVRPAARSGAGARQQDRARGLRRFEHDREIAPVGAGALDVVGRAVGDIHHDARHERLAAVDATRALASRAALRRRLGGRLRRDVRKIENEAARPIFASVTSAGVKPPVAASVIVVAAAVRLARTRSSIVAAGASAVAAAVGRDRAGLRRDRRSRRCGAGRGRRRVSSSRIVLRALRTAYSAAGRAPREPARPPVRRSRGPCSSVTLAIGSRRDSTTFAASATDTLRKFDEDRQRIRPLHYIGGRLGRLDQHRIAMRRHAEQANRRAAGRERQAAASASDATIASCAAPAREKTVAATAASSTSPLGRSQGFPDLFLLDQRERIVHVLREHDRVLDDGFHGTIHQSISRLRPRTSCCPAPE